MKLNVTHQLLAWTDDDHLIDKNILTFKKTTEGLLVTSKEMISKKMLQKLHKFSCFKCSIQDRKTTKSI